MKLKATMGNSSSPPTLCTLIFTIAFFVSSSSITVTAMSSDHSLSWLSTETRCHGRSISECMMNIEFEMDSEINRRILATSSYISYKSLRANNIPCSRRGASYYNCQPGAEANPYQRGCTAITRCRS
ncbi:unnamed protein product [Citrullus colocynthis]|uniref:Uncharacterized protein n=1 Tax=Citrullus colocynthis TaxID=252529 RepID=A0ABP0YUW7_9ROSI